MEQMRLLWGEDPPPFLPWHAFNLLQLYCYLSAPSVRFQKGLVNLFAPDLLWLPGGYWEELSWAKWVLQLSLSFLSCQWFYPYIKTRLVFQKARNYANRFGDYYYGASSKKVSATKLDSFWLRASLHKYKQIVKLEAVTREISNQLNQPLVILHTTQRQTKYVISRDTLSILMNVCEPEGGESDCPLPSWWCVWGFPFHAPRGAHEKECSAVTSEACRMPLMWRAPSPG